MTMSMFGRERRLHRPQVRGQGRLGWRCRHTGLGVIPGFQDGRMHYEHVVETPDGSIKEQILHRAPRQPPQHGFDGAPEARPVRRG